MVLENKVASEVKAINILSVSKSRHDEVPIAMIDFDETIISISNNSSRISLENMKDCILKSFQAT